MRHCEEGCGDYCGPSAIPGQAQAAREEETLQDQLLDCGPDDVSTVVPGEGVEIIRYAKRVATDRDSDGDQCEAGGQGNGPQGTQQVGGAESHGSQTLKGERDCGSG